jgi:hypothetical protein
MTLFLAEVEKELPLSNEPNLAGRLFCETAGLAVRSSGCL